MFLINNLGLLHRLRQLSNIQSLKSLHNIRNNTVNNKSQVNRRFYTQLSCQNVKQICGRQRFTIHRSLVPKNSDKFALIQLKCSSIHTSPKRYNPIVSTIVRQILKITTMFTARAIRKWYQNLPNDKRKLVLAWLNKHRLKLFLAFTLISSAMYYYYHTHIQLTPITERKRFIAFTPEQFQLLNRIELETKLKEFAHHLLPSTHHTTLRVAKIVKQLIDSNQDLPQIKQHDWTVSIIDDENVMNAFVLPSGNIFVFTGLLKFCDNDHQLGIVLAHELSHAILAHGIELASHAHILDIFFIAILGILWMFLPTDSIAAIGSFLSKLVMKIMMETPYSKMLETEADIVGMNLAAKACFDVREASVFWSKMSFMEQSTMIELFGQPESPINLDFLSTHPSHDQRSENLNRMVDEALKNREKSGCPPLRRPDPRLAAKMDDHDKMFEMFRKELHGLFHIKDFKDL